MGKNIQIVLSDEAIKELWELENKLNPEDKTHPFHKELGSYEEYYKANKRPIEAYFA